jgi:hypothetical protein
MWVLPKKVLDPVTGEYPPKPVLIRKQLIHEWEVWHLYMLRYLVCFFGEQLVGVFTVSELIGWFQQTLIKHYCRPSWFLISYLGLFTAEDCFVTFVFPQLTISYLRLFIAEDCFVTFVFSQLAVLYIGSFTDTDVVGKLLRHRLLQWKASATTSTVPSLESYLIDGVYFRDVVYFGDGVYFHDVV